jgi:hypothetical protein
LHTSADNLPTILPTIADMAPPPPPAVRHTLSVPTAATFVALVAFGLYGLAYLQRDDVPATTVGTLSAPTEANASAVAPPVAPPPAAEPVPVAAQPAGHDEPVSTEDAAAVVDEFRLAYQSRDVARLVQLFAPDASENGTRGIEAIESAYRRTFGALEDLRYRLPSISIEPHGASTDVRAPFVISYREPTGTRRELHGEAEWKVSRRDGRPVIIALTYRIDPES